MAKIKANWGTGIFIEMAKDPRRILDIFEQVKTLTGDDAYSFSLDIEDAAQNPNATIIDLINEEGAPIPFAIVERFEIKGPGRAYFTQSGITPEADFHSSQISSRLSKDVILNSSGQNITRLYGPTSNASHIHNNGFLYQKPEGGWREVTPLQKHKGGGVIVHKDGSIGLGNMDILNGVIEDDTALAVLGGSVYFEFDPTQEQTDTPNLLLKAVQIAQEQGYTKTANKRVGFMIQDEEGFGYMTVRANQRAIGDIVNTDEDTIFEDQDVSVMIFAALNFLSNMDRKVKVIMLEENQAAIPEFYSIEDANRIFESSIPAVFYFESRT